MGMPSGMFVRLEQWLVNIAGTFGHTCTYTCQLPIPMWQVRVCPQVSIFIPRVYPYPYLWQVPAGLQLFKAININYIINNNIQYNILNKEGRNRWRWGTEGG